jgi:glutamyl-tRNA reductase
VSINEHRNHILCIGLNHQTSSVALRERLALTPLDQPVDSSSHQLVSDLFSEGIHELVVLSTCNRVELYAVASTPSFEALETFLAKKGNLPVSKFSSTLYKLQDGEAVQHLFQVAAGLDSLVIGEPQILGQVAEAYQQAKRNGSAGKLLSCLFQAAIRAGKRTRTETSISRNPASISSVAVNLINETVYDLSQAKTLVLGAGEMAELAVQALRKRGASQIVVVNRTTEKAKELAKRWGGQAASFDMLANLLPDTDIVITSTGAPHIILNREMVERAILKRPGRPLVIMDIAVPRDVAEEVSEIDGVQLYDMDGLSNFLESSLEQRKSQIPLVETILVEEQAAFEAGLAALDMVPIIVEIRQQADAIRQSEMEKAIRRMPQLTPEMERQIEALTVSIVNKILHSPTNRLRQGAETPQASDYATLTRYLFGLE